MTKDEVLNTLTAGGKVHFAVWTFSKSYMCCEEEGCCDCDFDSVEDAVDHIGSLCDEDWDKVFTY